MSIIRKLSNAVYNLPPSHRDSSPDRSVVDLPKSSPSWALSSFSPRKSFTAVFQEKECTSSSDDFSDLECERLMSKNAQKRKAKKQRRESRSRHSIDLKEDAEQRMKYKLEEASKHETEGMKTRYGELPLMQSTDRSREYRTSLENIKNEMVGHEILFRARLHHVRRMGLKLVFFIFRQQINTIQGVLSELPGEVSIVMLHWAEHIPKGSIVKIKGVLQEPEAPVKSTSIHELEVKVSEMRVIVRRADSGK